MEYLTKEDLAIVLVKSRTTTGKRTTRGRKDVVRSYETWFKFMRHFAGNCENPNCLDTRKKSEYPTTMVATISTGVTVCRFCYLDGYGAAPDND